MKTVKKKDIEVTRLSLQNIECHNSNHFDEIDEKQVFTPCKDCRIKVFAVYGALKGLKKELDTCRKQYPINVKLNAVEEARHSKAIGFAIDYINKWLGALNDGS